MNHPRYLHKQGDRYYFRRRFPGFSTEKRPTLVSLGTNNESIASTWLGKLTVEFDEMLEDFMLRHDELPEDLIARYVVVRLRESMKDVLRKDRLQRCLGRGGTLSEENRDCLQTALEVILRDGLRKAFPTYRICPNWTPNVLENVMRLYSEEIRRAKSPKLKLQLAHEFLDATGIEPWSSEHHDQILEVYLQARLTSLKQLDDQRDHRADQFRALSVQLLKQSSLNLIDGPSIELNSLSSDHSDGFSGAVEPAETRKGIAKLSKVLTPGVEIIQTPLTLELLNKQFDDAAKCDEALHRSTKIEPFGIDIAGACERSIKIALAAGKIDLKTADSRRAKTKLFCLLANVQTVTEIEQYHLRVFEEQLDSLPLTFNRSPKDAKLTLKEIRVKAVNLADDQLGRSPKTYNSHLETVGSLLTHASDNEKSEVDPCINTKIVRRSENKRARRKRNSFKPEETRQLFQHTVWHGSQSADRRHESGSHTEKDGLYFVPLIVAYTGGRMEEIAGLTADGIVPKEGHYGFDIRPHEERRLKNLQSERLVPLHEHLIDLGLLEHQRKMQDRGEKFMFPELFPTSAKKKFQSALRYNWRKLREIQLDGNPRHLDGHSLRHAFNQALKLEKDVMREVRLDLLGHAGIDLNEEVYGDEDGMPFEMKKAAIDLLTRVF